jgi:uncharacterized membrane protein YkoI
MNKKILAASGLLTAGLLAGSFMSIAGANAADATSTPAPTSSNAPAATAAAPEFKARVAEEVVTGDLATTLSNLAKARVTDATVVRVEKISEGTAVYEVHMVKADGIRVDVYFDANNAITSVETKPARAPKGEGKGPRGPQEVVTGDLATTLTDLAKAKVTDATVERVVKDTRDGAAYAVLMKKADGTRVVVHFDANNAILSVDTPPAHGPKGPGPKGEKGGKGGGHGRD